MQHTFDSDAVSASNASTGPDTPLSRSCKSPLVVDLDGTLTPVDTLYESIIRAVRNKPLNLLRIPIWLMEGRASFKARIAGENTFSAENLPLREPLVAYLREQKSNGRRLVLATAAHRSIAESVARSVDLFDMVLASDETNNLKGATKLETIQDRVGPHFVYAGDSAADLKIWEHAEAAILIGRPPGTRFLQHMAPIEREFPATRAGVAVWLKALRLHQWLKNLLIFVPLLTAFAFFDSRSILAAAVAFIAFSCAASATYLMNDLLDLDSDRQHPRKRNRPLASGHITIIQVLGMTGALLVCSLLLATVVSSTFLILLVAYITLTSAYSWLFKHYVLMDVLMLAALYTLRILAGSVAIGVVTSSWLLAFSIFMFFGLALVKRCSELVALTQSARNKTSGRDYRVNDLEVLWPMGIGASLCSVVVFGLFINTDEMQSRYESPQLMWLVGLCLLYWLGRIWIKTARGEMHDDPLVFALQDFGSRVTITVMVIVTLAAHLLELA